MEISDYIGIFLTILTLLFQLCVFGAGTHQKILRRNMADVRPKIFAWIDTSEKFDEEHG